MITLTPDNNIFMSYLHVHHSDDPKPCFYVARKLDNTDYYLSKRFDHAHAFTISELSDAERFVHRIAKGKLWIKITPINCAECDGVLTSDQRKLLRLTT